MTTVEVLEIKLRAARVVKHPTKCDDKDHLIFQLCDVILQDRAKIDLIVSMWNRK